MMMAQCRGAPATPIRILQRPVTTVFGNFSFDSNSILLHILLTVEYMVGVQISFVTMNVWAEHVRINSKHSDIRLRILLNIQVPEYRKNTVFVVVFSYERPTGYSRIALANHDEFCWSEEKSYVTIPFHDKYRQLQFARQEYKFMINSLSVICFTSHTIHLNNQNDSLLHHFSFSI